MSGSGGYIGPSLPPGYQQDSPESSNYEPSLSTSPPLHGAQSSRAESSNYGPSLPPELQRSVLGPALPPGFEDSKEANVLGCPSLPREIDGNKEEEEDDYVIGPLPAKPAEVSVCLCGGVCACVYLSVCVCVCVWCTRVYLCVYGVH